MILDIFKKRKCEHDYKLYNIGTVPLGYGNLQYEYRFICPKCKKEFSIEYVEILDIIDDCKEEFSKLVAIGEIDTSKYKEISFGIQSWQGLTRGHYKGKYINWVLDKLKGKGIKVFYCNFQDEYVIKGADRCNEKHDKSSCLCCSNCEALKGEK